MRKLYFTAVLLLCTFLSYSQTQWIGPAGGDWSTAANWTNGVPAAGNDALITGGSSIAINNPLIIDYGVTSFSGDIAVNADVFNIGNFINSGGNMTLSNGALFLNSGSVTFTNDGPFSNDGHFLNYGTFNQNGNGVFNNNASGLFTNFGNITNIGNFINDGTVNNYGGLTNASTYVNNALTNNFGQFINTFVSTLDNNAGATFHNHPGGQLFIDKDFNNAGTLEDDGSTVVNAAGLVANTGVININGLFQLSTIINNDGTVNVTGTYKSNFGTTNNNATWNNSGTTENLGTFNNNAGSTLANTGTLMNASCATFFQRSNGTINSMTNDGVLYELNGTVNATGASQGVSLNNANSQPSPVLICRDIQIQTDSNGEVDITAGDVLVDGDAKYCNIVTIDVTQMNFTCGDLGVNPVTVTLTDGFGNSSTCDVNVTVVESSPNPCNTSFLNYCNSAASNTTSGVHIQEVSLAEISNTSANGGYSDFTNQVGTLEFGNFFDLDVITAGTDPAVTIGVWIDWNNDGDFDDADEEIINSVNGPTSASAVVNVPGTALPGTTRMRVSMRGAGAIAPCSTNIVNGEVEDYTIMIASNITIQNCVGDIVVSAQAGATEQVVGWIPPKGFSTCQNSVDIELVEGLPNGSAFPVGTTTNTFRFYDGCGGELFCSFDVTVNPTPVTFSLACLDDVILEASAGLGGAIANWLAPFPTASCPNGVNLPTQTVGPQVGTFLPTGTRVTVCYEATDNCGNTDNCCFDVFVTDPAETLEFNNCPTVLNVDAAPGAAGAVVTYPNFTATSSCAAGGVNIILQDGLPSGSIFPAGTTTVTYRATDDCNSAALCSFLVTVNPVPSEITTNCPEDMAVDVAPGSPSQVVNYGAVTATSNCPGPVSVVQTQGLPSGSIFPLGNTVVQYVVNDACGGTDDCTFNVTLNLVGATTTINCPNDLTVNADPGDVGAIVTFNTPTATSDCFAGNASVTLVSALASGDQFPLGTQEVIYFASDDCGTSDGCSFFVTVEPTQADLNLSCRNNITRNVDLGILPIVNFAAATGTTTCGGNVNITQIAGPTSGSAFDYGVTTITYRGTDNCGNVELCSFDVIVNANLPADNPEITVECLEDITITAAPGQTVASVGFDVPTATTTCNGGSGNGGGNDSHMAPSICADRTVSNVDQCSNVSKTMWINFDGLDYNYSSTNSQFIEYSDGTATFTGTIINNGNSNIRFDVAAFFSGRTTTPPTGSPKTNSCANVTDFSNFYYYTNTTGILTGKNNAQGALIKFSRIGEAFQVGLGGDVTGNSLTLGASGWLQLNIISQPSGTLNLVLGNQEANDADFNFKISGNGNSCRDNGIDCSEVPNSISGYTYLGQYHGKKYFSSNSTMSFATARNAAEGLGGNIVAIGSQAENDFITSAMSTSGYLGFTDEASEGNFVWVNGESVNYTNWNANEPNNSNNEDFTQIRTDGLWNDIRNITSRHQRSIIEIGCPARSCASISDNISGYTFIGEFENSKYYVANGAQSWESSRDAAIAAGGHLAVVTSQAENDFINNNGTASSGSFWLGLQNVNQTTTFQWINGESVSYTNWNDGEPNETHNDVYARMIDGSGKWTDRTENLRYNGVLEIECGISSNCQANGRLKREVWNDLAANRAISSIPLNTTPDLTDIITSFETPFNIGDRYGTRVSGWVIAPQTGNYTFWISSDNNGELWLSTDENPNNTSLIASLDGNSNRNEWDRFPSQQSVQISLVAGTSYYIEALLKENSGGDHLAVGWQLPDGTLNRPITGQYLSDQPCHTGSSEATITQVAGLAPNTNFPVGTTTVIYEVTDDCGNTAYCEFDVTVNQPNSAIALNNCPTDITVTAAAGATSAVANFTAPTATSDCTQGNVVVSQIGGFASGQAFPVGQTTVSYRAVDGCGNEQFCSFFVIVEATDPPATEITVNCPTNIMIDAAAGATSAVANFTPPTGTTTCTGNVSVTQIGGLPSGSNFPIGTTVAFYRLADECGNVESCAFNIVVNSTPSSITISCPANVSVDAAPDADYATATFAAATATSTCFTGTESVFQIAGLPTGSLFPLGNNVIFYRATDACGNTAVCNFLVTVNATPITNLSECVNAGGDADGDGVCADVDCDDNNPLVSQAGDSCNDGNPATSNDVIQADCSCAGVIVYDCPTLSANIGDACDDGNANTNNDQVQADCSCAGTVIPPTFDCPALQANIGDACNDGNPNTSNDQVQADCSCAGTVNPPTFDCPALSANIGDACDDGDATTNNDVVQSDCTCAGTPASTDCDVTYTVDGLTVTVQNLTAPITTVQISDATFSPIFSCNNFGGTACNPSESITLPSEGTYFISVQTLNAFGEPFLCDFFETIEATNGGGNPTFDCPALSANIGDACNDGNSNTNNDVVQADCSCAGTPVGTTYDCPALSANIGDACDDGDASTNNDTVQSDCSCAGTPVQTGCIAAYTVNGLDIDFSSIDAPISTVKVFDNTFATVFACDNFGGTVCADNFTVTVPSAGIYFIQIQTYQDWATPLCNVFDEISASGGGTNPTFDCPALSANIGDACNDGNANTNNDVVQADCSCAGTPVGTTYDCPALSANIGDACNDGNSNTSNDVVQADCSCAGTVTPPTYDCPALSANIGDACNDGDASTNNDTVQSDCSCAGTPVQTGCVATYTVDGLDIDFQNIDAPISTVKVFDGGFGTVFACDNFGGTACANNFTVTLPSAGTYFIQIQTYQDWATPLCDEFATINASGTGGGNPTCDNVTGGGSITGDETVCSGDDAGPITSSAFPSGGSGTMEYIWLSSTFGCPVNLNNQIAGATQSAYDPGVLTQTTYFKRLSRRAGCTDWFSGESNCVVKTIDNNCGNGGGNTCDATYTVDGLDITLNNISANIAASAIFDNTFAAVFTCNNFGGTACNNNETITVPGPGTYFVQIQTYTDWSNQVCNIFEEVTVTGAAARQQNGNGTNDINGESLATDTEEFTPVAKVFPNPAMGSVNIALEDFQNKDVEIRLVSAIGKVLKTIPLQSVDKVRQEVSLAGITNGIYTVVILTEGEAPVSRKLIVRRGY